MTEFDVWYTRRVDGRAPEFAFLMDDYAYGGKLRALDKRELARQLLMANPVDISFEGARPLRIGDVVRDPKGVFWTFTPSGSWASIHAFECSYRDV